VATPARHPIGVHVGPGLTDDNELDDGGPLARAAEMDADGVQVFLADPQGWTPKPRPDAEDLLAGDVLVVVHAPYVLNVATTNNRIRIPSRKLLGAHARPPRRSAPSGMVVHGGHVLAKDDPAVGVDNWRKTFARQADGRRLPAAAAHREHRRRRQRDGPRPRRDRPAVGGVGEFGAGFVLDTCHAWAAGWDLATAVDDVRAITGRVDLVHLNNSRDPHGSSRDRHAPLTDGEIPTELLVEVARAAGCPVVLETPGDAAAHAEEIALLRSRARRPGRPEARAPPAEHPRSGAPSRTPPAGSSTPGQLVRTTSPSGRSTSRTTRAIRTTTATSRSRPRGRTTRPRCRGCPCRGTRASGHPQQRLGGLPQQQRAPLRPGQHRQRQQPQRVLRAPHLVQQQEAGHQQEGQLGHPRPHRRGQRQPGDTRARAPAGDGDDRVEHRRRLPLGQRPVEEPVVGRPAAGSRSCPDRPAGCR
jgi:deoxyribonuclease-4